MRVWFLAIRIRSDGEEALSIQAHCEPLKEEVLRSSSLERNDGCIPIWTEREQTV